MRTKLDPHEADLAAARESASLENRSLEKRKQGPFLPSSRIPLLPVRSGSLPVTDELICRLREEEDI